MKKTAAKLRLSPQAKLVLARRYLKRDQADRPIETPAQMFERVARTVAASDLQYGASDRQVDRTADRFFDLMVSLDFLPNSPTLMNAGRDLGQLSACFVLPVEDSIESIFNAVRDTALIHKSGGGTGFSFSSVRPAHDRVKSTHGVSSGPISFMNVFDVATETIKQGGVRRGANMGLLSVHHPDILEFIGVKADRPGTFTNFNLSVSADDVFMRAVQEGGEYDLVNPHTGAVTKRLSARDVFDRICRSAWACGDPGLVFIDRVNRDNPLPSQGPLEATNPCGEQPLLPYESCTLGSINLSRFVRQGKIEYPRLAETVRLAVHFLDNVIDVNRFPLEEIKKTTQRNRKIGLGVMGLADLLIALGRPYDSEQALETGAQIMAFIRKEARRASADLARRRGNFPAFIGSIHDRAGREYMRNATVTTIAPTGSISIIAGCSSGIEPLFALAYRRVVLDDRTLIEIHPRFRRLAKARGFWTPRLEEHLTRTGRVRNYPDLPAEFRDLFPTAHDLTPEWHLKVQAVFQEHTDNAVSKTVNLPQDASPEAVEEIFFKSLRPGAQGSDRVSGPEQTGSGAQSGAGPARQDPRSSRPLPGMRQPVPARPGLPDLPQLRVFVLLLGR